MLAPFDETQKKMYVLIFDIATIVMTQSICDG